MFWPDFRKFSTTAGNNSVSKKLVNNSRKRKKQITPQKIVYESGEIHISDESDDGKNVSVIRQRKQRTENTPSLPKNNRRKFDLDGEVVIEWSSDEESSKTPLGKTSRARRCPLALSNEKVPVTKRDKVVALKHSWNPKRIKSHTSKEEIHDNHSTNTTRDYSNWFVDENSVGDSLSTKFGVVPLQDHQISVEIAGIKHTAKSQPTTVLSSSVNPDLNLLIAESKKHDGDTDKRARIKKGGYLEKLQKALSRSESDRVFWQHEREVGLAVSGFDAAVHRITTSYGRTIYTLDIEGKYVNVILFNNKLEQFLSEGLNVRVSSEDIPYHVKGTEVFISTNKIHRN